MRLGEAVTIAANAEALIVVTEAGHLWTECRACSWSAAADTWGELANLVRAFHRDRPHPWMMTSIPHRGA